MKYNELVKSLRTDHDKYFARDMEAADAIEELRKAVLRLENELGIYDELPTFYIEEAKPMGIYIEGMEMPTDGCHHMICIYADGTVSTGGKKYTAVPVPKHGRLIDADALIADIKRQCREVFRVDAVSPDDFWITRNEAYNERLWETWCESFFGYLRTRPTIIPAETPKEE